MENKKHKFDETIENYIANIVIDNEYRIAESNQQPETDDFEKAIDMLECIRSEKDYEWMSDIRIPEFASMLITEASGWANQYFQSRDFVDVFLQDDSEGATKKCRAIRKCINRTLNRRDLYHFAKYIRGRMINALAGQFYIKCWWEQEVRPKIVDYSVKEEELNVDEFGNEIIDRTIQIPAKRYIQEPVWGEEVLLDQFDYDVFDPRNVFTDNKYCYSLQQKDWIIFRDETTYDELLADEKRMGYINLGIVKDMVTPTETDTSAESFNKDDSKDVSQKAIIKYLDRLERLGKFWCIETKNGIEPGYDENGEIREKAQLLETIITFVYSGNQSVLVRFQKNPYRDATNRTYRPIIRGQCYIHPTKDTGLSDGKLQHDLQKALDDTFNMSQDRVKLATLPVLKGRKYSVEDNPTVRIEPEHLIELEDPINDLVEMVIRDDIQGALNQMILITNKMQQLQSVFPTTMGDVPSRASTTATAVAGAETRGNIRANYKSLTVEYTALTELYWMILQMTYRFAKPETAFSLMGDSVYDFDSKADYYYTPVSSNIELEQSKMHKIQLWDQILGRIVAIPNPKTQILINYIISQVCRLMGSEFAEFGNKLLDESVPVTEGEKTTGGAAGVSNFNIPITNQARLPMTAMEQATRERMNR